MKHLDALIDEDQRIQREGERIRRDGRIAAALAQLKAERGLLVSELERAQAQLDAMLAMRERTLPEAVKASASPAKPHEAAFVLLCSDWHVGETVLKEAVSGRNEYNPAIASKRVDKLIDGALWMLESWRSGKSGYGWNLDTMVVWIGGDLVSGAIHEDLAESNALSTTQELLFAEELLCRMLDTFAKKAGVKRIVCPTSWGNHGRCHDDQTELLTRRGWKQYNELLIGEEVATYPLNSGIVEWQPLQDVYIDHYSGPMVHVHTKTANFKVTPRHRMVAKSTHTGVESMREMQDFVSDGTMGANCLPKCASGKSDELPGVTDDELLMLGWLVTDGTYQRTSGNTYLRLYQSKEKGIAEIQSLLARLGIRYEMDVRPAKLPIICGKQVKTSRPGHVFTLNRESAQRFLALMPDKFSLPAWMNDLSERQFNVFLDGLMAGDGHSRQRQGKATERQLYGREKVLSQVQALAVVNGIPARVRKDTRGNYVLSLPASRHVYINDFAGTVKEVDYDGIIWCGTVANGTLITRRDGIPLVSGNTTPDRRVSTGWSNSYEWLLYNQLANRYAKHKAVSIHVGKDEISRLDVLGHKLRFNHGDTFGYGGGVGGITIPARKWLAKLDRTETADVTFVGHWHQYLDIGDFVCNGSLIGWGAYAQRVAPYQAAAQTCCLIDKKYGKRLSTEIVVQ